MLLNFSGTVHALSQLTPNLLPILQTEYCNAIHYNYTVPYNFKKWRETSYNMLVAWIFSLELEFLNGL